VNYVYLSQVTEKRTKQYVALAHTHIATLQLCK